MADRGDHDAVNVPSPPLPVGPDDEVGSPRLAGALAARDADAINRALRHDVVVVPLVRDPNGATQIRVTPAGDGRFDLPLFSSSTTLAAFLNDAPGREFDVQRADALLRFLTEQRSQLARVIFDPAGPHPVAAPVEAIIDALRPRPGDGDVARIAAAAPPRTGGSAVVDFRWAMPLAGWTRIEPAYLRSHPDRVAAQLTRSVRRLPRPRRDRVAEWLTAAVRVESGDNTLRELALLADGRGDGAFLVLGTRQWRDADESPDTDYAAVVAGISAVRGPDEELLSSDDAFVSASVRHTRFAADPVGDDGRVLIVDYYLAFPDGRGYCRTRFASPQSRRRDTVLGLTAPIVADGRWVVRDQKL